MPGPALARPDRPEFSRRGLLTAALLGGGALLTAGCTATPTDDPPSAPTSGSTAATERSGSAELRADDLVTGLRTPWGLALLADGGALVGERDTGRIVRVRPDTAPVEVANLDQVRAAGEGGLLGLTFDPDRTRLYAYFTAADDNRIVAMDWDGSRLGSPAVLLAGIPRGGIHNGGRMIIGPDGLLYVGTGETGDSELAQDRSCLGGKILRLDLDGRPADGNPFGTAVYSYGHRNVQGLAFDDAGRLWASEFGASSFDELNRIEAGANYGWPQVEGEGSENGSVTPQAVWPTGDASPSGLAFWRGSLWMAGLRGRRLWEIPVVGDRAGTPHAWLNDAYGRLRTVAVATDGDSLWLGTSNTDGRGSPTAGDDRLLRVTRP